MAAPAGDRRRPIVVGGLLLGVGLGGFFDGVVLHQILQWHHLLSATGEHPTTTVAGLEASTLADGLFHAFALLATLAGLILIGVGVQREVDFSGREIAGLMLAGWGMFNLVEGIVNHQILTLHHVNGDHVVLGDVGFLLFGLVLVVGGWFLARRSKPGR